jgi:hypothetical protein
MCITETVKDEGLRKLPKIVNRYFDRARIMVYPVRQSVYVKVRHRYIELAKCSKFSKVESDTQDIKTLYMDFLKVAELRKRLEKLQTVKNRGTLLPSETDMKILGEAKTLVGSGYNVCFVTDDGDFISFKDEIRKRINVTVVELLNLRQFASTLKTKS